MKFSSILLLSLGLVSGAAMAGGTTEAGVGGALGGVLGSVVGQQLGGNTGSTIGAALGGAGGSAVGADKRSRHYRDRDRDDRRYYRDGHPGRGHAYGHRKNKHRYRD